ncbi:MAG: TenA family transcriptional regulator [Bacteroidota bacterium]
MKNNRSLSSKDILHLIKEHKLSSDPPPQDSLFWMLWNVNIGIANQTLQTAFVQGIKQGTLDPVTYGGFNVSDAYYCFHGADDYQTAASRTNDPILKAFLLKKYNSYKKYNDTFPEIWHIKDADGIVPSKAIEEYSNYERKVVQELDPIYALVVMLPCEYLWAWLGAQLSPAQPGNLYAPWITGNNDPRGAYTMGNFLNAYAHFHGIDNGLAMKVYTQAMQFEYDNFATATPAPKEA